MWDRFLKWAQPAIAFVKPWVLSFLAGLVLAIFQAIIAFTDSDQPLRLSNLITVLGGAIMVYIGTKIKHVQLKDLQQIIDDLINAYGQQPQEPISPAIEKELEQG